MKPISNYDEIKANDGSFSKPTNGGYCVEILAVKEVPLTVDREGKEKGNYLEIEFDICHGDLAGYYAKQHEKWGGEWYAKYYASFKESALGMFKHFTNCIEESNQPYKWDWDEKKLVGKFLGVVLQEEEYTKNNGTVGVRVKVKEIKTIHDIMNGNFKVPQTKKLDASATNTASNWTEVGEDDELPFN